VTAAQIQHRRTGINCLFICWTLH